ncbi:hypothetical protein [Methylacidimicrobium tartarophylax]|uniref:High-affinity branched-chain amino acid transport ATP-binding protein LivF n=1 Tax=Methylacidimicrobium tartarophylax TaxID=1041768 RepID=A0A5E6M8G1_9BACT|nr:hypothetical protein [Methylacidimicrobium tartarophylax]VVM05841.1 High-affinity branched-chain amino acid transport ATP-binding protein LivF [Methylacidimicrobium tartarophylax]
MPREPTTPEKDELPLLRGENLVLSLPPLPPLRVPKLMVRPSGLVAILAAAQDAPPILERALLETLAGDRPAQTGRVFFLGQDLERSSPGWARMHGLSLLTDEEGYHKGYDTTKSVEANLRRSPGSSLPTWLFRFLPLEEQLSTQAGNLSPVERRWLALGCALAPRPRLLLLERPLEGLPALPREALLERLVRINLEEGIAFCFTAQPSPLLQTAASSVYRISSGRLTAD